jgi:CheY-like chemotaxis protein
VSKMSTVSVLPNARESRNTYRSESTDEKCRRILVVEDNPITQLVALQQLKKLNCIARAVSTGFAALEVSRAEIFDLILMDCRLPYLDGYETARAIRTYERKTQRKRVTIVAITADTGCEYVDKCMGAGMDGHLSKPVSIDRMLGVLNRFL